MRRQISRSVVSFFSALGLAACAFEALPTAPSCTDSATCTEDASVPEAGAAARPAKTNSNRLPRTFIPPDAGVSSPDASVSSDCADSECAKACPEGLRACNGECVDANSTRSCRGCEACAPGQTCVEARCEGGGCPPGHSRCGDRCVDLARDVHHCGACGSACPTGADLSVTCEAGECTFTCKPGYRLCRGECIPDVPLFPEPLDFPICDALTALRVTTPGALICPPSLLACDGSCTDVQSDPAHCGTCDTACPSAAQCRGARCVQ